MSVKLPILAIFLVMTFPARLLAYGDGGCVGYLRKKMINYETDLNKFNLEILVDFNQEGWRNCKYQLVKSSAERRNLYNTIMNCSGKKYQAEFDRLMPLEEFSPVIRNVFNKDGKLFYVRIYERENYSPQITPTPFSSSKDYISKKDVCNKLNDKTYKAEIVEEYGLRMDQEPFYIIRQKIKKTIYYNLIRQEF